MAHLVVKNSATLTNGKLTKLKAANDKKRQVLLAKVDALMEQANTIIKTTAQLASQDADEIELAITSAGTPLSELQEKYRDFDKRPARKHSIASEVYAS